MDRGPLFMGLLLLGAGLGVGGLMIAMPEGLNPDWPLGMALLAPAAFVVAGLHMISAGLGHPRLAGALLTMIALCLWTIVNWAAFRSTHIQCEAAISFLGVMLSRWGLSEAQCRMSLQALVGSIDAIIVGGFAVFAWRAVRARRGRPPKNSPPKRTSARATARNSSSS